MQSYTVKYECIYSDGVVDEPQEIEVLGKDLADARKEAKKVLDDMINPDEYGWYNITEISEDFA